MSYAKASLESLCELIVDCPHSTPKWTESGVIVLRNQNIRDGRLDLSSPSFTDEDHYKERTRRAEPRDGDLVFTREAPMGEICQIPKGVRCCLGQRQVLLRVNDYNDPRFILYAIQSPMVQHEIGWNEGTGSTVSNVRIPVLKALGIPRPELAEQREIAETLGLLDDKIELNRQTARTLEELTQRLFKSWFVDFDPVRAKMTGRQPAQTPPEIADLFPDRLVDSPLGPIPEGWATRRLEDVAALDTTSVKPASEPDAEWQHYSIPAFDSGQIPFNELGASIKSGKYRVKPGSVLVSKLNPGEWRAWLPDSCSITTRSICSTEFMQFVVENAKHRAFIWGLVNSAYFQAGVMETVSGTTGSRQRAQPKQVKQLLIAMADEKLFSAYSDFVLPMLDRQADLLREMETLSQLRDRLLPKLISGEIRVPEARGVAKESVS